MKNLKLKLKNITLQKVMVKSKGLVDNLVFSAQGLFVKSENSQFLANIDHYIKNIKESNGSAFYQKSTLNVGIITDEFMYNYYKDSINLININVDNYQHLIDNHLVDCLLFISCWHGMENDNFRGIDNRLKIADIFNYANEHDVKTIFQTIEDPTNYDTFVHIAKSSQFIFTSSIEKVNDYQRDCQNDNVFVLEYGINPLFHNPIGINEKEDCPFKDSVFFAGSWTDRYKNRCVDICKLFDGVINAGKNLIVADRNYEKHLVGYRFPLQYRKFLIPALPHDKLQKVHKLFDFNININTIQDSQTMCAMRVYELQALGCLMISNYAISVSENFPYIYIINDLKETKEIINNYSKDQLYQSVVSNYNHVYSNFTVYNRLNYILEKCGINHHFDDKKVLVLVDEINDHTKELFNKQTYNNKQLGAISEIASYDYDYVTYLDESLNYDKNYLANLTNGFKYTNVDYITKDNLTTKEFDYCSGKVGLNKSLVKKGITINSDLTVEGDGFLLDHLDVNPLIVKTNKEKEIGVIIPIYNNGKYLKGRCLNSLLRSSVFDKMHLYLIDDGSKAETIDIIKELEVKYDNIATYFFNDGGSGSASRPRNKGVEIACEKYITYLDPDNEALNDGYSKLYAIMKTDEYDMAFGAISKITNRIIRLGYLFNNTIIDNPAETLLKENFKVASIQGCLIKREVIVNNHIENPVSAIGQDSLFFVELMLNSKKVYYLNEIIHLYYAQRVGSAVNNISLNFFKKSQILEEALVSRLNDYHVLDEYKQKRLEYFFVNWYLEKFKLVSEEDKGASLEILNNILHLYGQDISEYAKYM
ncbi:MAG: glycosyltransferase [Erysipelotrichaceae bacterium]